MPPMPPPPPPPHFPGLLEAGLLVAIVAGAVAFVMARGFRDMAFRLQEALGEAARERERAERLEASRRELLKDISHELGTPLSAVQGWVHMLSDGMVADEGEREHLLRGAKRQLRVVTRMVRQLLDLSRWERSSPELHWEAFPITEPLMESADTLEEAAADARTTLSFQGLDPGLRIRGDRARVRELFQIFLENAIEHAGPGTSVVVGLEPGEERVRVSIRDNGVGISSDRIGRLGERGAGLGLAIAQRLVESHGGRLEVENPSGGGTMVRFSLPRAASGV